jgi:hypothetical protein
MADKKSFAVRKSIAILTVITAMFTVACETDEDPGTDLGDTDVTEPAGDLGTTAPGGDGVTTTTVAGG